jgi:TolB-like protein
MTVNDASKAQTLDALSGRERAVAEKFATGMTYREIGNALFIAPTTVRTHLAAIYEKLGVRTKIGLAAHFVGASSAQPGGQSPHQSGKPRLAVMPVKGQFGKTKTDADALTRALTAELGRFSQIGIVAAATMFALAKRHLTVKEIGRTTGANYVLEVAVHRQDKATHAFAHLVDAQEEVEVWSARYDLAQPSSHDELTGVISGNLFQVLMKHAAGPPAIEEAVQRHKLYLKAFYHVERPTAKGMVVARRLCERLLAAEPDHALIRETLAWVDFHSCFNGWSSEPIQAFRRAGDEARAGLRCDDREACLHSALGLAETYLGNLQTGLGCLRRAIALNPNDAECRTWLGIGLTYAGDLEGAQAAFARANLLSPDYHPIFLFRGDAEYAAGNYDAATASFDRFLMVLPEYHWARLLRAASYVGIGDLKSARKDVSFVSRESPTLTGKHVDQLQQARGPEFRNKLLSRLSAAGLPWK